MAVFKLHIPISMSGSLLQVWGPFSW